MSKLDKAREFEREAAQAATTGVGEPWRPTYHVTPPVGWMNDPNGFSFHHGRVHLFYQYNPYAPKWGPMHWGHCVTDDFVSWRRLPAAIAPDKWYDGLLGCFSGTAIGGPAADGKEGGLVLMYTGVSITGRQQQCIARSKGGADFAGIDFIKDSANPVIPTRRLPAHAWKGAFRDPKVFFRNGAYWCLVGTQDKRTKTGMLLLYRSPDLRSWTYVNEAYACPATDMIECPDLAELGGFDLLIFSPTNHPQREDGFANLHASVYSIGKLDADSGTFSGDEYREIDGGFDFYAPQTLKMPDGRTIMIAWMQMWKRSMPTVDAGLGWAGAMTLSRELEFKDGVLLQAPVREIERYRSNPIVHKNVGLEGARHLEGVRGDRVELNLEVELGSAAAFSLSLFVGTEHRTVLRYDRVPGRVALDRSRSGVPIRELHQGEAPSILRSRRYQASERLRLRVFLDRSSVEVFLGEGELTLTSVVYPDAGDEGIEFACEGGEATLVKVEKWDIEAKPPTFLR